MQAPRYTDSGPARRLRVRVCRAWTWAYADIDTRLTGMTVGPVALDVRKTDNFPADLAERMLAGSTSRQFAEGTHECSPCIVEFALWRVDRLAPFGQ